MIGFIQIKLKLKKKCLRPVYYDFVCQGYLAKNIQKQSTMGALTGSVADVAGIQTSTTVQHDNASWYKQHV